MKFSYLRPILAFSLPIFISIFAQTGNTEPTYGNTNTNANTITNSSISNTRSMSVIEADPSIEPLFEKIVSDFKKNGQSSVGLGVLESMNDPQYENSWKEILSSTKINVINVEVHPNQASAVAWMNKRFEKMGIPQLQMQAVHNSQLPDPTELSESAIKIKKWIRYSAGPGVALAATYLGLPALSEVSNLMDYGLLILPTAGMGITTVLLEFQFAHPYLNNHFWKKVWEFGGPVTGRFTNIFVNFLYGMSLYGAGSGASHLPLLWGGSIVEYAHLPFMEAVVSAFIGGVIFHVAMGQYQTDLAMQQTRGNISASERYSRETTGVVVNNGARVLNWVMPSWNWLGYLAQWGFFTLKTAPQLWQTYVAPYRINKKIKNKIDQLKIELDVDHVYGNQINLHILKCSDIGLNF